VRRAVLKRHSSLLLLARTGNATGSRNVLFGNMPLLSARNPREIRGETAGSGTDNSGMFGRRLTVAFGLRRTSAPLLADAACVRCRSPSGAGRQGLRDAVSARILRRRCTATLSARQQRQRMPGALWHSCRLDASFVCIAAAPSAFWVTFSSGLVSTLLTRSILPQVGFCGKGGLCFHSHHMVPAKAAGIWRHRYVLRCGTLQQR